MENQFKSSLATSVAVIALMHSSFASAEEVSKTETAAVPLDRIVVTATRTERDLFTTPFSGSVVDNTAFEVYQPQNFGDIFDNIPGATVQGGSRRIAQEPNIRGFSDQQLVLRLDGARQNFDLAHRGRFFADNDLVSRVEVLRGGASSLFGSGAIGGVISLETLDARDLLQADENYGARVKAGYQTNGEEPTLAGGVFGAVDKFDALANFVYRDIKFDLKDGNGNAILDTTERLFNGLAKFGFEPTSDQRLEVIADIYDSDGEGPTDAADASSATTNVDRSLQEFNVRGNYSYSPTDNPFVDLKAVAYYSDIEVTEDRVFDSRLDETDFKSYGVDIGNTSRMTFGDAQSLAVTYGFEYFQDKQSGSRGQTSVLASRSRDFPDAQRSFLAGYMQAELDLFDVVSIIPGVRFDSFKLKESGGEDRSENEFSPRIAVGIEPTSWLYLWGSYSEAFRAPSLTELYSTGVHFQVPNGFGPNTVVSNEFVAAPDLEPETAQTFEAGFRLRDNDLLLPDDRVSVSGTFFKTDIENYIDTVVTFFDPTITPVFVFPAGPTVFFGTTAYENVDAEIKGFEGELKYESTYFDAVLLGALADGKNTLTDAGLGSIPQNAATMQLAWKIPSKGVRLGGRVTKASAQKDVPADSVTTDGYETVDLFASWAPTQGYLEGTVFTIGGDNIFDEVYSVHPQAIHQPGKSFRASVSFRFGG